MGFLKAMERSAQIQAEKTVPANNEDRPVGDFFETTVDDYNQFETHSWNKGEGYKLPSYPMVEEKLEGLDEGLYLFAAESNVGKSAVMLNMMYDACTCPENKLFGIYYSLDDSKYDIIPRGIAMNQMIPIRVGAKPQRYQNMIDRGEEDSAL